jgi:phage terminase small subunit
MPILRNARHEAFAQALVSGKSLGDANVAAGYKNDNRKAAWITRQNPKIAARIVELTEEKLAAEKLARERAQVKFDVSAETVIGELARIGFSNMQDYLTVGPDGELHFDFARITRDQAAALQEMVIEEFMDGRGAAARKVRRIRFKLADKRSALVDLGKHLGIFADPIVKPNVMHNYFSERPPTLEEWRAQIEVQAEAQAEARHAAGIGEPELSRITARLPEPD